MHEKNSVDPFDLSARQSVSRPPKKISSYVSLKACNPVF